ncbi:MAG: sulfite exporter TauE/SafE family protein [Deltaproteobacteria bacterium]|nr:sulfite exporter TauE/SafE family protein [Deltaproteobacteria bacterium]
MMGMGGGFIFVPLLIQIFPKIGIHHAIATSTCFVAFSAISSYLSHSSTYAAMKKTLLWIFSGSIIGAILGPHIALIIPEGILSKLFTLVVALPFIMRQLKISVPEKPWILSISGLLIGMLSSIFGIGGGVVLMPLLTQVFHKDIRYSITTSTLFIVINSSIATAVYTFSGVVEWRIILFAAPAGILGARLGAKISHKTPPIMLNTGIVVVSILIIIKMLSVG